MVLKMTLGQGIRGDLDQGFGMTLGKLLEVT